MPVIDAKIVGSVNLGNVLNLHVDYKVDVKVEGTAWSIYRRYSAFENLHKSLTTNYGEEKMKELNLLFPEKSYSGSIVGTFKSYVTQRTQQLQNYLNTLLAIEGTGDIAAVGVFFDLENKGISGMQIQLGPQKILKESFARTKFIKNLVGAWTTSFVVVLTSGNIVVLPSMYDNTSKAECNINISKGAASVVPHARNNTITITELATGHRLKIAFSTSAESAFWIRTLSDFSVSTSVASDTRSANEQAKQSAIAEKRASVKNQPVEHLHDKGTGNTVDELSAAYGI